MTDKWWCYGSKLTISRLAYSLFCTFFSSCVSEIASSPPVSGMESLFQNPTALSKFCKWKMKHFLLWVRQRGGKTENDGHTPRTTTPIITFCSLIKKKKCNFSEKLFCLLIKSKPFILNLYPSDVFFTKNSHVVYSSILDLCSSPDLYYGI